MEPLRGNLVNNTPKEVKDIWEKTASDRSSAQWALRYLWDRPEVSVVLSGMNEIYQIDENIEEASKAHANTPTQDEKQAIDQVKEIYKSRLKVDCTECKYCMPCPVGVDIQQTFHYNRGAMLGNMEFAKSHYNIFMAESQKFSMYKLWQVC